MNQEKSKEIEALVYRLKYYNRWRRGSDEKQPDPTQLGKDIDHAINLIEGMDK